MLLVQNLENLETEILHWSLRSSSIFEIVIMFNGPFLGNVYPIQFLCKRRIKPAVIRDELAMATMNMTKHKVLDSAQVNSNKSVGEIVTFPLPHLPRYLLWLIPGNSTR